MMSKAVFILGCASFVFRMVSPLTALDFRSYKEQESLGGKICSAPDVIFSIRFEDWGIFCADRCSKSADCLGVFYDSATKMCTGCSGRYDDGSTLDVSMGVRYYISYKRLYHESCLPEHVCIESHQECFTDTCICSPGYSYNPSNQTCVNKCDVYGTTFQEYPNRRVPGTNLYGRNVGVAECLTECISNDMCLSVDYSITLKKPCKIADIKTTSNLLQTQSFTHYARDCA